MKNIFKFLFGAAFVATAFANPTAQTVITAPTPATGDDLASRGLEIANQFGQNYNGPETQGYYQQIANWVAKRIGLIKEPEMFEEDVTNATNSTNSTQQDVDPDLEAAQQQAEVAQKKADAATQEAKEAKDKLEQSQAALKKVQEQATKAEQDALEKAQELTRLKAEVEKTQNTLTTVKAQAETANNVSGRLNATVVKNNEEIGDLMKKLEAAQANYDAAVLAAKALSGGSAAVFIATKAADKGKTWLQDRAKQKAAAKTATQLQPQPQLAPTEDLQDYFVQKSLAIASTRTSNDIEDAMDDALIDNNAIMAELFANKGDVDAFYQGVTTRKEGAEKFKKMVTEHVAAKKRAAGMQLT